MFDQLTITTAQDQLVQQRLDQLIELFSNGQSFLFGNNKQEIYNWITTFIVAYNERYFDIPISKRKTVEWNNYSWVRYNPFDSITGLISEAYFTIEHNKHNDTEVRLQLTNQQFQKSNIDAYIYGTNVNGYDWKGTIQIKSGYIQSNMDVPINWIYNPPYGIHRIVIVDINNDNYLMSDYNDFLKCISNCKLDVSKLINNYNKSFIKIRNGIV